MKETTVVSENDTMETFTDKEYNSRDGMLTTIWGPGAWHLLHTISFNYPVKPTEQDKKHYRDFILQLRWVLPCGKCRENLVKNLKKLPLRKQDLENRNTFSKYVYELHELVNRMLHKESGLTYETVRERYEHFRARCGNKTAKKRNKLGHTKTGKICRKFGVKKEKGCTEPLYEGEKSKCVLNIVPQSVDCPSLNIDKKCFKHRVEI